MKPWQTFLGIISVSLFGHFHTHAAPGELKWTFPCGATVSSPAIGADGTVYIGGSALYAVNPATGSQKWAFQARHRVQSSPALGPDGTVYFGSIDKSIYAVDGTTGAKRWEVVTGDQVESSAAVAPDGTVYIASFDGKVYALDGQTGQTTWAVRPDAMSGLQFSSSPAVAADGTVYIGANNGILYALDGATGQRKWAHAAGSGIEWPSPAIGLDGTVYIGSWSGECIAVNGLTGQRRWTFQAGSILASPVLGADGTVYIGSLDGKFYALDGYGGQKKWQYESIDWFWSSAAVAADKTVYVGGRDSYIYALDSLTGRVLWKYRAGALVISSPAIAADGTVLVASNDGLLYALEGSSGPAISPWPKHRGTQRNTGTGALNLSSGSPQILVQPDDTLSAQGSWVTMAVVATGTLPLSYQWHFNGASIPNATNPSYSLPKVALTNAGTFYVVVANQSGSITSRVAHLEVGYSLELTPQGNGTVEASPALSLYPAGTLVTLTPHGSSGHPFLRWRGDANGSEQPLTLRMDSNKRITAEFQLAPGEVRWEFRSTQRIRTTPAIGPEGTVYFKSAYEDRLYAIDPVTGIKRWQVDGVYQFVSPSVGRNGVVHAGNAAFAGATGARLWSFSAQDAITTTHALGPDGTVYVGSLDKELYALAGNTGSRKWSFGTSGMVVGSAAISPDGSVLVGSQDGKLYCLDSGAGKLRWSLPTTGPIRSSVGIGANGTAYVAADGGVLFGVDIATGAKRWETPIPGYGTGFVEYYGDTTASPVVGPDGTVYLGSDTGRFYALDGDTGSIKWTRDLSGPILWSAALIADGTLYVGCGSFLYALDSATATNKWIFQTEGQIGSAPNVMSDGTVLIGGGSTLYAVAGSSPLASNCWPSYRGDAANSGAGPFDFLGPPRVLIGPISQLAVDSTPVRFGVLATGTLPLSYQWFFNQQPISGATANLLTIPTVNRTNSGGYHVAVSNAAGAVETPVAMLSVGYRFEVIARGPGTVETTFSATDPTAALKAIGSPGHPFLRWEGDASGTENPLLVPLDSNKRIIAIFQLQPGEQLWAYDVPAPIVSSPALGLDGTIYFGANDGRIHAVDPVLGTLLWQFGAGASAVASPALGSNNLLYCALYGAGPGGVWFALDANSGFLVWDYQKGVVVSTLASPAVDQTGTMFLGESGSGTEFRAHNSRGQLVATFAAQSPIESSAALGPDGSVIFGCNNGKVYALSKTDFRLLWEFLCWGPVRSSPAWGDDGHVYFGSDDGRLYAVDGATGVLAWQYDIGGPVNSSPIVGQSNIVYIGSESGVLAVDGLTGALRWKSLTGSAVRSTAALAADGTLYVGCENAMFYALDGISGAVRWQFQAAGPIPGSPTVAPDGTVYFAGGSKLYALNGTAPLADCPWPKFRGNLRNTGEAPSTQSGAPKILSPPQDLLIAEGQSTRFGVVATGGGTLTYQWYFNDAPIPGANRARFDISPVGPQHAGRYWVVISSALGTTTSRMATLNVGYSVVTGVRGAGSVTISPSQPVYLSGSVVTLVAKSSNPARHFLAWIGNANETNNPLTLTINSNVAVVASFELPTANLAWSFGADSELVSTPAIADAGVIYVASRGGRVFAVDSQVGRSLWVKRVDGHIDSSLVLGNNQTLYVVGNLDEGYVSHLFALDTRTGALKWRDQIGISYPVYASPAVSQNGTIYVGTDNFVSFAYDAFSPSGGFNWEYRTGGPITSSAAVTPEAAIIFGSQDSKVYRVNAQGLREWEFQGDGPFMGSPALSSDGTVVIGSDVGTLYALDGNTGKARWSSLVAGRVSGSPIVGGDDTVFAAFEAGRVRAYVGATGTLKWDWRAPGKLAFAPALAGDGVLWVAAAETNLVGLNAALGTEVWHFTSTNPFSAAPTIGPDRTIYIPAGTELLAVQGSAPLAPGPWSKYRGDLRNSGAATPGPDGQPQIVREPESVLAAVGITARFGVVAGGGLPLSYQWYDRNTAIPGATNSIFALPVASAGPGGSFSVTVSNAQGTISSRTVELIGGFTLTVSATGLGSVGIAPQREVYMPGDVVSLNATPGERRRFLGWLGDIPTQANPLTLTIDRNLNLTAGFSLIEGDVKWSFAAGTRNVSSPALNLDGTVHFTTDDGHLYLLDPQTGAVRADVGIASSALTSPVLGNDSTVYIASANGLLYCIDSKSGQTRWNFDTGGSIADPPALAPNGVLFVVSERSPGTLYALDANTGQKRWEIPGGRVPVGSPLIDPGGTVYMGWFTDSFRALRLSDGSALWSVPTGAAPLARSLGADGTVYVSSPPYYAGWFGQYSPPNTEARDWALGSLRWRRADIGMYNIVLGADGALYGISGRPFLGGGGDGGIAISLAALDPQTGRTYWTLDGVNGFVTQVTPVVGNDATVCAALQTGVVAVDGYFGLVKWKAPTASPPSTSFALAPDGTLYIGAGNRLYAIMAGAGLDQSSWPKGSGDNQNTGTAQGVIRAPVLSASKSGSEVEIRLYAVPGAVYEIERTEQLNASPIWQPWKVVQVTNSPISLTNENLNASKAFFRARSTAR